MPDVHGLTDVTGFALLGHLLEICRGSQLSAEIDFAAVPVWSEALVLAKLGYSPGAAARNWKSYGHDVTLPAGMADWQKNLLCDPQTSGGLLVSCAPEAVDAVMQVFHAQGFADVCVIGSLQAGAAKVVVR
jgi:selenide,water dikinase